MNGIQRWLFSCRVNSYIGSQWELRPNQILLLKMKDGLIEWMKHMDCCVSLFLLTTYSTLNLYKHPMNSRPRWKDSWGSRICCEDISWKMSSSFLSLGNFNTIQYLFTLYKSLLLYLKLCEIEKKERTPFSFLTHPCVSPGMFWPSLMIGPCTLGYTSLIKFHRFLSVSKTSKIL